MSYDYSIVLIAPAALQDQANRVACALGHDTMPGRTYSIALSASGAEPVTHYGAHAWGQATFVATLYATGVFPPPALEDLNLSTSDVAAASAGLSAIDWSAVGLTAQNVTDVTAELIASARIGGSPRAHWSDVVSANGLQEVSLG